MNIFIRYDEASEYAKNMAKEGKSVTLKRDGTGWLVSIDNTKKDPNITPKSHSIWVGRFLSTGAIVVFDSSVKIKGVKNLFGYVPARDIMRQFYPEDLEKTQPVFGNFKFDAINKYLAWREQSLELYVQSEINHLESRKQEIIKNHQSYFIETGKPYLGVNLEPVKKNRHTHCFACHESLDSDCYVECKACGWLICACGACGCNYNR